MTTSTRTRYLATLLIAALVATPGAGCTKQVRKRLYLSRADRDFAAGNYDRAEIEYLKVFQVAPLDPTAMGKLGLVYYDQGRYVRALSFLKKAAELTPDDPAVRLKLSLTELHLRQFGQARTNAMSVLQKQPGQDEALSVLAESAFTAKEIEATRQQIGKLQQQDKDRPGYHIALGIVFLRQGHLTNAQTEFNKALELDPKLPATQMALAGLRWQQRDLAGADRAFQAAIQVSPPRSPRRLQYADFKLRTGSVQEAKQIATEMTEKTPDFLPAWMFLAQMALRDKKPDESYALTQKVLARDEIHFDALLLNGELLLRKGDGTNAVVQFERAIKAYGPQPKLEYDLALAQLLNKQAASAMASLGKAIAADTNYADAILLQANLNLQQRNAAGAILSLSRLAAQRPGIPQPQLLLARAYAAEGRLADALAIYRQLAKNFAQAPAVLFQVGNSMLGLLHQPEEAAKVYRQIAEAFPTNAPVLYAAGKNLATVKHNPQARQAFEKALSLDPNLLPAVEGLVDLDLAENQAAAAIARVQKEIAKNPRAALPWLLMAKIHLTKADALVAKENAKKPAGSRLPLQIADVPAAQDDAHQAEAALLKTIELDSNLPAASQLLARLYVACNKQKQALERMNSLVARTNDPASLMLMGMIQEEVKDFPAARDAYEKLLNLNPNAGPALNNLAFLYAEHLGQLDRAYELAQKASSLMPDDPSTADTLGWVLYRRGDYARAADLIEQAASGLPTQPEVRCHLGMVNYMLGQEQPARLALQEAVKSPEEFPSKEEARRMLAVLGIDVKTAGAAQIAELEKRLKEAPGDPVVLARLGSIYERDGAVDKAIVTYEVELKYSPQAAHTMFKLAQLYVKTPGQAQKALEMAKQAHSAAPDDARISALLGRLVFRKGDDYKWSASLLEESARKLTDDPLLSYDLAWAEYSLGRLPDAEAAMRGVFANPGGLPAEQIEDAKRFLGLIAAAKGSTPDAKAAADAEKVLVTQPDYVPALFVSALAQQARGNYKAAAQRYDRALARFPLFAPATRELAILCCDHLAEDQRAYDLAVKARQSYPEDGQVAKALGILTYRKADYSRAAPLLKQSAQASPTDGVAFYYLGMAQYQLKSKAESKASLQKALALNLPAEQAAQARRLLAELK
jgi:tetratricopeptide (TPR) repeat protein